MQIRISIAPIFFLPASLPKVVLTLIKEVFQQRVSLLGLHMERESQNNRLYTDRLAFSITEMKSI